MILWDSHRLHKDFEEQPHHRWIRAFIYYLLLLFLVQITILRGKVDY